MKPLRCFAALFLYYGLTASAQSPVVVSVQVDAPGPAIPDDYIGLSYETQNVLPDNEGRHLFSPGNAALIKTFGLLGVHSLRVGGNTADGGPIPSGADIDDLFAFAKSAGVKVIYTLKLKNSEASENAPAADRILTRYAANLTCFSIGNEPTMYIDTFSAYQSRVKNYMGLIDAKARFCGADVEDKGEWAADYANAFAGSSKIALVTEHHYVGNGRQNAGAVGRDALLAANAPQDYAKLLNTFAPTLAQKRLSFRLAETNSFFHGGAREASNTFASALWGLDYLHWFAAHGAAGINFHTGDTVSSQSGGPSTAALYAVFVSSINGYHMRPLAYAVKAFDVGGHGRVVPVSLNSADGINLTAYAVLSHPGDIFLTLINKEHDNGARAAKIRVATTSPYATGRAMFLRAGDVSATEGVTLGEAAMEDDGTWNGRFSELPAPSEGTFALDLPPATAVVIELTATKEAMRASGNSHPDTPRTTEVSSGIRHNP